jgi:cytochrome P450
MIDEELFNPHCNNWLKNKFKYYEKIRQLDTVYYSKNYNMFVLVDYTTILDALKNSEVFMSGLGNLIVENTSRFGKTLGASDNPIHDEYKSIVKTSYSKDFSNQILKDIELFVQQLLTDKDLLNISQISISIASFTVTKLLGLPHKDSEVQSIIESIQLNAEQCVKYNTSQKSYNKLLNIINNNIVNKVKADSLGIYNDYTAANNYLNKNISLFTGPTISGASSLAGAIQFLVWDLHKNKLLDTVLNDFEKVNTAVQESLRYNSTTGRFSRTVTKNTVIKNTLIPANSRVALCLDAAGRDPKVFENPDIFCLDRPNYLHLAFGHGIHACIALYLSRSILEIFLKNLLRIFGKYTVIDESSIEYTITASGNNDMLANLSIAKLN